MKMELLAHNDISGVCIVEQIPQFDITDVVLKIVESSAEMKRLHKASRKPIKGHNLPVLQLGQSINVLAGYCDMIIRYYISRVQTKGVKIKVIQHETHFEIGRIE